jgi:beta-lactamase class A
MGKQKRFAEKMKRVCVIATVVALSMIPFIGVSAWADSCCPTLRQCHDQGLQQGLEMVLNGLKLTDAVNRKQLSVALVDISTLEDPRVAAVNGDHMVYAASLPKIAILLGAFKQIETGEMAWDEQTRRALTDMIRFSSNRAASEMLRRVGPDRLADILQSPDYCLYAPRFNGGLWCGKEYGTRKAWKRDPLHNYSHGATAMQTARFYYLLETNQLVNPRLTGHLKEILSRPKIHHKFVKGLKNRPGSKIYRKSGTWKQWHADSALVEYAGHRYIIVGLAQHPHGGRWLEQIITPLHDLIVQH